MTNLYLDLPVVHEVPDSFAISFNDLMGMVGSNTGNLAFRKGLANILDLSDALVKMPLSANQWIDAGGRPSNLIFSAANWIGASLSYEEQNLGRRILMEKSNCNVSIFGLGAQAASSNSLLDLGPETIRFLEVLSERCACISVRDLYTAELLSNYVKSEIIVTGCPSNFINLDSQLPSKLIDSLNRMSEHNNWIDLKVYSTEFAPGTELSYLALRKMVNILLQTESAYVCQSPELIPFLLNESEFPRGSYQCLIDMFSGDESLLRRFLKNKGCVFFSIDAWLQHAKGFDLAFGMRIHGNMLALQAGVPSLLVAHDSRTEGLAKSMSIPYVLIDEFVENQSLNPSWFFEKIQIGLLEYESMRSKCARGFMKVCQTTGLRTGPSFDNFISSLKD